MYFFQLLFFQFYVLNFLYYQIENFTLIDNGIKTFSVDLAQLEDLNFDYFGNSGDIKVPISFNLNIEGSDFNSSELDKSFGNMFSNVGYNSIKFDFGTEWEWNTNKNNILLNLNLGVTDAASIDLSSNFNILTSTLLGPTRVLFASLSIVLFLNKVFL